MEASFSLPGVAAFYSTVSLIGIAVAYFLMPETEGRSLEDIELHFSDNSRGITDRHIQKNAFRNLLQRKSIGDLDKLKMEIAAMTEKTPSVIIDMILRDVDPTDTGENDGVYNKGFKGDS